MMNKYSCIESNIWWKIMFVLSVVITSFTTTSHSCDYSKLKDFHCEFRGDIMLSIFSIPGDKSSQILNYVSVSALIGEKSTWQALKTFVEPQFYEKCLSQFHVNIDNVVQKCLDDLIGQLKIKLQHECGPCSSDELNALDNNRRQSVRSSDNDNINNNKPIVETRVVHNGIGNVFGSWFSVAAMARSINAPFYFMNLKHVNSQHGGLDIDEFKRIVSLPPHLKVFEGDDDRGLFDNTVSSSSTLFGDRVHINYQMTGYYDDNLDLTVWVGGNNYLPESFWLLWQGICDLGDGIPSRLCQPLRNSHFMEKDTVTKDESDHLNTKRHNNDDQQVALKRSDFFLHYRAVQNGFFPRVDLLNPIRHSYFVMHVRRGDRSAEFNEIDVEKNDQQIKETMTLLYLTLKRRHLEFINNEDGWFGKTTTALDSNNNKHDDDVDDDSSSSLYRDMLETPWIVIGDSKRECLKAKQIVIESGFKLLARSPVSYDQIYNSMHQETDKLQTDLEDEGQVEKERRKGYIEDIQKQNKISNTFNLLRDFFLISHARGLIPNVLGDGESSFSTVAANLGNVPLLFPFLRNKHLSSLPVFIERQCNFDLPIKTWYFQESISDFIRAVIDPGYRERTSDVEEEEQKQEKGMVGQVEEEDKKGSCSSSSSVFSSRPFKEFPHIPFTWKEYTQSLTKLSSSHLPEKEEGGVKGKEKEVKGEGGRGRSGEDIEDQELFSFDFGEPCFVGGINVASVNANHQLDFKPNPFTKVNVHERIYQEIILHLCAEGLKIATRSDFFEDENLMKKNNVSYVIDDGFYDNNLKAMKKRAAYYELPRVRTFAILAPATRYYLGVCEDPIQFKNQTVSLMEQGVRAVAQQCQAG